MNVIDDAKNESVAIIFREKKITFSKLKELTQKIEKKITKYFLEGDRVIVSSQNPVTFIATLFACYKSKIVFCCWDGKSNKKEIVDLVSASGCIVPNTQEIISVSKNKTKRNTEGNNGNLIITTSGSTGTPKGVLLDLEDVIQNAKLAGERIFFGQYNLSQWCIDIDFSLMSALNHLFMAWHSNVPINLIKGLNIASLREIFLHQKSGFGGAPLQLLRLSQVIESFSDGSLMVSSGDFLSQEIIKNIKIKHLEVSIATFYGLTELSGRFCYMSADDLINKPGAAGKPIQEETIVIEDNQIKTESRFLYKGYFVASGKFEKRKIPFNTGDIGFFDRDGFLWLKGRLVDNFKVSGLKVNRKEIELTLKNILIDFNFIILPVKHDILGSCCALFVEDKVEKKKPPLIEIIAVIKGNHSSSCIPVYSYLLKKMPLLSNGKLNKQFMMINHFNYEKYR